MDRVQCRVRPEPVSREPVSDQGSTDKRAGGTEQGLRAAESRQARMARRELSQGATDGAEPEEH